MSGKFRQFSHILRKTIYKPALITLIASLAGCSGLYEVRLNDRLVYDPFPDENDTRDALLADTSLQGCLNEQINSADEEIPYTSATLLACSSAAVKTLEGIEKLTRLEQLDLSSNSISDINDLARLNNLRVLSLSNNQIRDIRALYNLPLLRSVNLTGNNGIPCSQLDRLQEKLGNGLSRPVTCQN